MSGIITIPTQGGFPAGVIVESHKRQTGRVQETVDTILGNQQLGLNIRLTRYFEARFEGFHETNAARALDYLIAGVKRNHPYSSVSTLDNISVSQIESASPIYELQAEYTNRGARFEAWNANVEQPFWLAIEFNWEFRERQFVVAVDIHGNPILNTAGDPYDPPIEESLYTLVIRVNKKIPFVNNLLWGQYSISAVLDYQGTVHGDYGNALLSGYTIIPWHGKISNMRAQSQIAKMEWGDYVYIDLDVEVELVRSMSIPGGVPSPGFRRVIQSAGFNHLQWTGAPDPLTLWYKVPIKSGGEFVNEAAALDIYGRAVGLSGYGVPTDGGYWQVWETLPASDLRWLFANILGITQP